MYPRSAGLILAMLSLLAGAPAGATTYVPMTDEALVDQAPVIAVAEVQGSGSASWSDRPATDYRVRAEKVLKGGLPFGEISVRVPGGVRPDGVGLKIWGAPRFETGEKALLFLSPREDGSYAIVHLMLGAFHEVSAGGRRLAVRALAEARPVLRPGETAREPVRDFDLFARWVAARARGVRGRTDYEISADPGLRQIADRFSLFEDFDDGYNMRWFLFDSDGTVEWRAHQNGQTGVLGGGFTEFQTALSAWNNDAGTNISYSYGGTTASTNGLSVYDTVNSIVFNDPTGLMSPFSCFSGGVLAIGGPWYESPTLVHRGSQYHRILNADIVTNDGIACFFQDSPNPGRAAEELFGHELGHTLGLGHSCGDSGSTDPNCDSSLYDDALMRAYVHDDTRGARLNQDDRAAIATLYTPMTAGTSFFTVTPCRLLDTREPDGPYGGPSLAPGLPRTIQVSGQCGIPATAAAISVNVTALGSGAPGHLTLYPADQPLPSTSTVNFSAPQARANNAILPLSADGALTIVPVLVSGISPVDAILDVNGYFE